MDSCETLFKYIEALLYPTKLQSALILSNPYFKQKAFIVNPIDTVSADKKPHFYCKLTLGKMLKHQLTVLYKHVVYISDNISLVLQFRLMICSQSD